MPPVQQSRGYGKVNQDEFDSPVHRSIYTACMAWRRSMDSVSA
jgi:hypothetical protein